MNEEYLLIAEWFDEEEGKWKPVLSKKPVILLKENENDWRKRYIQTGDDNF